ncbi:MULTISPECIES: YrzE family protein [Cytobacillus]|uniref:YrzE family protein n=1 Tax=Cytobacillus TaxID=2675230 RepID=UPI00203F20C6|nr:YrzE family protein [Cytobacillus kochii]MCM3323452.1 YrzE family protein [Cytobacillus kochii]MCM3345847.1 YrzE family protein [Cytobacillus kochii]MDM5206235.1 YrzE family protein [Cytobacillus kochii]
MGELFIFSLIIAVVSAVILFPVLSLFQKGEEKKKSPSFNGFLFIFVLLFIIIFSIYYFTNLDRNMNGLVIGLTVLAVLGGFFAKGIERKVKLVLGLIGIIAIAYMSFAFVFNADKKFEKAQMQVEEEIETFDENETPASVPPDFARNKMKKAFGQVPNTSYYELGSLQIQKVDGQYVYIAPVEFSGFFKWIQGDTTPGYFTVSATDSSANPKFIKSEMAYTPSSFLNKDIYRQIRLQYPDYIFYGDVQLEIDDEGKPFYIRTYGEFISARNGFNPLGIVMVDPLTGAAKQYKLKDVPAFIDGAVSPETVSLHNSYFGKYVNGYWNSLFGKSDVKLPSDEGTEANVSPIFDEKGDMYYFTDFTSPKEGVDSMLGYSLTNSRTGEATYYTGNLEESYMDSQGALQIIEKKFIEKKWYGKMPILYNFYGEASWLTPVLDTNGFLQNYFIVSAANPEIAVYASTPNDALKQYKTALQRGSGSVEGSSSAEEVQLTGKVVRVYKERVGESTNVSFLLEDGKNFIASTENNPLAIYLQEDDEVEMTYLNTGEMFLPVKEMTINGLE